MRWFQGAVSGMVAMGKVNRDCIQRAEHASEALARALIWGGLAVCVVGSAVYDIWMFHW
jgi:hypothetical protein